MPTMTTLHPRLAPLTFLPEGVLQSIDVDPDSSHLLWTASTTPGGYPRVSRNGQLIMLARWIAEEVHGPAPTPKHQAGHICHDEQIEECPFELPGLDFHRLCCNPEHIRWQTARENVMGNSRSMAYRNAKYRTCPASWHRAPEVPLSYDTHDIDEYYGSQAFWEAVG